MGDQWIEMTHARVGELRVGEESLIHFDGLPGFPSARRFALVQEGHDAAFQWLACLDDAELAFVVTDPRLFFPSYDPTFPKPQLRALGAKSREEIVVLAIANLAGDSPRLNLAAPLIVHLTSRRAAQVVLDDPELSIAQPLPACAEPTTKPNPQIESKPQT